MSTSQKNLTARFLDLKPHWRVVVICVGALFVYVFLDDYCWNYARIWATEGNRLQALIERGASQRDSLAENVKLSAIAFGSIEIPNDVAKTSESLALAVNETMKKHRITLYGYDAISAGKLTQNSMPEIAGTGGRIERIRGDVQFEISPDDLAQIISDFENNPSIDSLNSIKIRWLESQKKIDIRLSAEAWAIASRDTRKKGGT
ncbi:MAG: hypothetical protein O2875_07670 [Planctomycetota bacterium]|nr:hypothetical protein [Planctomycetota bacterium]MDA1262727.1 hypothetical protein [Planctomycetota bacterium]